ncbi:hypothetical protein M409DRAFT_63378 [Zasmidium cellare ATCC 36951]|uniref:Dynactin subunit 6 n=1 Tax=Zasmidium cellare ATCC 36951 TaxID=1080233 RepID=A0A6A6CXH0_ZASCE|nr:uncharacterized protein M409DRAFT_63378 [Zasmidium cellare ATCC 36951]KAF2171811.1 hypothetical protein M409DRAFT_63378 [Zasmidium cellare ATCC 36951]
MTTRPAAPSSRPSESIPRPPLKIHSLAIVADRAQITGTHPITIGENTIIHPHARLRAETAPITIGKNCSVSEKALVSASEGPEECVIGDGVDVQGDAVVENAKVGDWTVIEVGAKVGRLSEVGKYCKITPLSVVLPGEGVEDFTVVFGDGGGRRVDVSLKGSEEMRAARERGQAMMLEVLGKLILDGGAKWRGT